MKHNLWWLLFLNCFVSSSTEEQLDYWAPGSVLHRPLRDSFWNEYSPLMSPENPRWPLDVNTLLVRKRLDKGQVKPPVQTTQQTQHVAVERMDCCYGRNTMAWREGRGVLFWKAGTVWPSPMCSYTRITLWSAVWSGSHSLFSLYLREKKYGKKTTKTTWGLASGDTAGFRLLVSFWSVSQCWWQQKGHSCGVVPKNRCKILW